MTPDVIWGPSDKYIVKQKIQTRRIIAFKSMSHSLINVEHIFKS